MPADVLPALVLPPFRAVLFDLDGTLVRTFIDFGLMREAMRELSHRMGTDAATENETDVLEIVAKMANALGGDAGDKAQQDAYALLTEREVVGCAHPEPIEPASSLLYELRTRKIGIGIITRNCRAVSEDLTRRMDLPHDVLIAREDTDEFKPHAAPVLAACEKLRVSPSACVMVGDLWADIASGKNAGVAATVGIAWPRDGAGRFTQCAPDWEVPSLVPVARALLSACRG